MLMLPPQPLRAAASFSGRPCPCQGRRGRCRCTQVWLLRVVLLAAALLPRPSRAGGIDGILPRYYDLDGDDGDAAAAAGRQSSPYFASDADLRRLVAKSAVRSAASLLEMKTVYESGSGIGGGETETTLQSLSTSTSLTAKTKTFESLYDTTGDFADQWVQAAFANTAVFENVDFAKLDLEGRQSAIRWGILTLHVWTAVASSLEQAVAAACSNSDTGAALAHWNNAFALYTGSLVEGNLPRGGYMIFGLVQKQCWQFGTCPRGKEEATAPLNIELVDQFVLGKTQLGDCDLLSERVGRIESLMTVPIIQGALRAMYAMDREDDHRSEIQGEAVAFAAALGPILSECSTGSAGIVYKDMLPGQGPQGSFEVVKGNLERH